MKANKFLLISRKEAIADGKTRYFTGLPCKRLHIAERRTSTSDCVECSKIRQQSDKNKQYKKIHYENNKNKYLTKAKKYYEENRIKKISYASDYQIKNARKIYQRNKVLIKEKIKNSPWIEMNFRLRAGLSHALRKIGNCKNSRQTMDFVGCSLDYLKDHFEKQFLDGMTWENRSKWHIDHITPVSTAKSEDEVIALYHFTNLRPIWAADNIRKSNKKEFLI